MTSITWIFVKIALNDGLIDVHKIYFLRLAKNMCKYIFTFV